MIRIKPLLLLLPLIGILYNVQGYTVPKYLVTYQIQGLRKDLLIPIQTRLDQNLKALAQPLTAEAIQSWYQHTPLEIQQVLAPYGYFKSSIRTSLQHKANNWYVIYQLTLGPLLSVTQLKISLQGEGRNDNQLKTFVSNFPIRKGSPLLSKDYEQAKQTLLNQVIAQGYLSAYFTEHRVLINRKTNTANITLRLNTGPRYYFGPIIFQQSILKEDFLKRYLPFRAGDPYSSKQLLTLQDKLSNSGYFQQVFIQDLTPEKKSRYVPSTFQLIPRPTQQYTAGIGYSTDVGIRGTLGWESRYLNPWGHRLSLMSQLSKVQNSLQASYIIPGRHPYTDSYNINFAIVKKHLLQVDSTTQQLGLTSVAQWKKWQRNLFLNYQIERFNYPNRPFTRSHLLTPGINLSRSHFDNPLFALHGYSVNINLQGADKQFLSSASFLQTQLQGQYILSWNKNSRLLFQGNFGYTFTPDPITFPPSLLFYAGGSQSVRGYAYQSLGPGRYLLVGSTEYQHRLINNFYGTVFFDAGNAVNNFPINLRKGTGIGVVWASPLGPVELTLARGLDLPGHPLRLQFSLGATIL